MMTLPPLQRLAGPVPRRVFFTLLAAPLMALGGCFWGGTPAGMELTMEESVAAPQPEPGPIKFVWEGADGEAGALITTTTSTTTPVSETFIARQKIAEHRRKPIQAHRIVPPLNLNAPPTPPKREPAIRLVPLDGGLVIRKRAAALTDDVNVGQKTQVPMQRLINSAPSGNLSVGNLQSGRVTVLGVTQETIPAGTTKGP